MVSVIIPAYNAEKFIGETLTSVLASDYRDIEVIIIDDGSKDNTLNIAEEYAAKDNRIAIITQPNGGVCRARNNGISHAKGEYILPVDADDILLPHFIGWAVEQIESNENVKVVVPRAEFFGEREGEWRLKDYSPELLARKNMIPVTALYRRTDWIRTGGYCETLQAREDWNFWIGVLKEGGEVIKSDEYGLRYRIQSNSKRKHDRKFKKDIIKFLNSAHPEFMQQYLGGPLRQMRTWSKTINTVLNLLRPRKVVVNEDYADCRYFVEALPQIFSTDRGKIIKTGRNEIREIEYHGHQFVVKSFGKPNIINRFVYGFIRKSKAQRSYEYANMLIEKGIGSPAPVAWMTVRNGLLFTHSYYVSLKSECPFTYADIMQGGVEREEEVLKAIARTTALMHKQGIIHTDYSRGNILFGYDEGGEIKIEIIDLNRIRFREITQEEGLKNLSERLPATPEQWNILSTEYAQFY